MKYVEFYCNGSRLGQSERGLPKSAPHQEVVLAVWRGEEMVDGGDSWRGVEDDHAFAEWFEGPPVTRDGVTTTKTHRRIILDCPSCPLEFQVVETRLNEKLTAFTEAAPPVARDDSSARWRIATHLLK